MYIFVQLHNHRIAVEIDYLDTINDLISAIKASIGCTCDMATYIRFNCRILDGHLTLKQCGLRRESLVEYSMCKQRGGSLSLSSVRQADDEAFDANYVRLYCLCDDRVKAEKRSKTAIKTILAGPTETKFYLIDDTTQRIYFKPCTNPNQIASYKYLRNKDDIIKYAFDKYDMDALIEFVMDMFSPLKAQGLIGVDADKHPDINHHGGMMVDGDYIGILDDTQEHQYNRLMNAMIRHSAFAHNRMPSVVYRVDTLNEISYDWYTVNMFYWEPVFNSATKNKRVLQEGNTHVSINITQLGAQFMTDVGDVRNNPEMYEILLCPCSCYRVISKTKYEGNMKYPYKLVLEYYGIIYHSMYNAPNFDLQEYIRTV
jgi:hypothetical protein